MEEEEEIEGSVVEEEEEEERLEGRVTSRMEEILDGIEEEEDQRPARDWSRWR